MDSSRIELFMTALLGHLNISMYVTNQRRKLSFLKLDFQKAFDKVDYSSILLMLKHKEFGDIWLNWISCILHTASTSVLLNGVPGKKIHCKRGVRQGDPLHLYYLLLLLSFFNV
jgi:hypothetical protein